MYAEIKNGVVVTWPFDWDNLVRANPDTSFASDIGFQAMYAATKAAAINKLVQVTEQEQPSYNPATQKLVLNTKPTEVNGSWVLGWTVQNLTAAEAKTLTDAKAASVREERNRRIAESDWTQLPDSPVDKKVWATYRQALRDLTKAQGFPWGDVFPNKPE